MTERINIYKYTADPIDSHNPICVMVKANTFDNGMRKFRDKFPVEEYDLQCVDLVMTPTHIIE